MRRKRASAGKGLPDPETVFAGRSAASRAADLSREHSQVITPEDAAYSAWVKDGGTADISGVDTRRPVTDRTLAAESARAVGKAGRRSRKKKG